MRKHAPFSVKALCRLLPGLLLGASLPLQAQTESIGKVLAVRGEVEARDASGAVRTLVRSSELFQSDTIVVGADGYAQLKMVDDALFTLKSDTEFAFNTYSFDNNAATADSAAMSMLRGGFMTISGTIGDADEDDYRVDTPYASIGIRGTMHSALIVDGALLTGVYDGGTTISNNEGNIDAGIGADFDFTETRDGEAPRGLIEAPTALGQIEDLTPVLDPNDEEEAPPPGDNGANAEAAQNVADDQANGNDAEPPPDFAQLGGNDPADQDGNEQEVVVVTGPTVANPATEESASALISTATATTNVTGDNPQDEVNPFLFSRDVVELDATPANDNDSGNESSNGGNGNSGNGNSNGNSGNGNSSAGGDTNTGNGNSNGNSGGNSSSGGDTSTGNGNGNSGNGNGNPSSGGDNSTGNGSGNSGSGNGSGNSGGNSGNGSGNSDGNSGNGNGNSSSGGDNSNGNSGSGNGNENSGGNSGNGNGNSGGNSGSGNGNSSSGGNNSTGNGNGNSGNGNGNGNSGNGNDNSSSGGDNSAGNGNGNSGNGNGNGNSGNGNDNSSSGGDNSAGNGNGNSGGNSGNGNGNSSSGGDTSTGNGNGNDNSSSGGDNSTGNGNGNSGSGNGNGNSGNGNDNSSSGGDNSTGNGNGNSGSGNGNGNSGSNSSNGNGNAPSSGDTSNGNGNGNSGSNTGSGGSTIGNGNGGNSGNSGGTSNGNGNGSNGNNSGGGATIGGTTSGSGGTTITGGTTTGPGNNGNGGGNNNSGGGNGRTLAIRTQGYQQASDFPLWPGSQLLQWGVWDTASPVAQNNIQRIIGNFFNTEPAQAVLIPADMADLSGTVTYNDTARFAGMDATGSALQKVEMSFNVNLGGGTGAISNGELLVLDSQQGLWRASFQGDMTNASAVMTNVNGTYGSSPLTGAIEGVFTGTGAVPDFVTGFVLESGDNFVHGLTILNTD